MDDNEKFDQAYSQLRKTLLPYMRLELYPTVLAPILEMICTVSLFNIQIKNGRMKAVYAFDSEFLCRFRECKLKKIKSVLCSPSLQEILNSENCNRDTCLHYAVGKDNCDVDVVDQLLKHGANPNKQNKFGDTPLHLCARFNCPSQMMELLLKYGGNPNIQNLTRDTPLHCAARKPDKNEIVRTLLENGAKTDIFNYKCRSVLHTAFESDESNLYLIQKCLEKQPSLINSCDLKNMTPLHLLMRGDWKNKVTVLKLFLNSGANVNARDMDMKTPLHWIQYDFNAPDFNVVQSFIDKGADINAKDLLCRTPLFYVIRCHCYNIAKQFILCGAKVNVLDKTKISILCEAVNGFELGENVKPYYVKLVGSPDTQIESFFVESQIFTLLEKAEFRHDTLLRLMHFKSKDGVFCVNNQRQYELIQLLLENGADPGYGNLQYHLVPFNKGELSAEKLLVQYRVIKNFVAAFSKEEVKNVELAVQAMTTFELKIFDTSYCVDWHNYRNGCIIEVSKMAKDKLNRNLSVFKFVAERCSTGSAPRQTDFFIIDEYLLRLNSGNYPYCRDIMYAAIKRDDLEWRLLHLLIYTPSTQLNSRGVKTISLNSHVVSYIMKFLSKFDLVNLAVAYRPVPIPVKPIKFCNNNALKRKVATDVISCSKYLKENN